MTYCIERNTCSLHLRVRIGHDSFSCMASPDARRKKRGLALTRPRRLFSVLENHIRSPMLSRDFKNFFILSKARRCVAVKLVTVVVRSHNNEVEARCQSTFRGSPADHSISGNLTNRSLLLSNHDDHRTSASKGVFVQQWELTVEPELRSYGLCGAALLKVTQGDDFCALSKSAFDLEWWNRKYHRNN